MNLHEIRKFVLHVGTEYPDDGDETDEIQFASLAERRAWVEGANWFASGEWPAWYDDDGPRVYCDNCGDWYELGHDCDEDD